ncbi:accessory Sec system translocase SecA2 [Ureibacillus sp. FSL K6-8385]|uniref:accessory Sec system translocase SecA2 n=1 Tax=Ureibacillus sp. FSL K6-8385 TaxID=2954684 RepID=UPI003159551A
MFSIFKHKEKTGKRELRQYYQIVEKINQLENKYSSMPDDELRKMTGRFKELLANGAPLSSIIPDAFAVVREASRRVIGMRHYDVQLIGGLVLAEGNIAEMATGEGKTLVASLPSYVRALEGKGVHVITVNDYLAKRDFELIGQIHQFLGLTVGLNLPSMDTGQKKKAYQADITYGIGTEFGFDYLRDNMVYQLEDKVQRPYHFAIIDEVDSVLIDEAKTPLIIAGKTPPREELIRTAAALVKTFQKDKDYEYDPETKAASLTEQGIDKTEAAFGIDNLYDVENQVLFHYVIQAVRAKVMFQRDVDYIVKDGQIKLIDMFTGRILEGRALSDGLHQAIEAKEGMPLTDENKVQAHITIQNYFRMYPILSGMTGTAKTQEKEFLEVYNMRVVQIPTNRPVIRIDHPDIVFETREAKYEYVAQEAKRCQTKGQPVLIGTTSILQSEELAKYLDKHHIGYQLLNAKNAEQEAELIARAGQKGQVTVATNMAGRGTDIKLGEGVAELGGLYVIGTEKHESRRIDLQLRGRSGRQGDPGESRFILSLEDEMLQRFAAEDVEKFMKKMVTDEKRQILNKEVRELVGRTQQIVEGLQFTIRQYNLQLDNVINEHRNLIYALRDRVLQKESLVGALLKMLSDTIEFAVREHCADEMDRAEWRFDEIEHTLNAFFLENIALDRSASKTKQIFDQVESGRLQLQNWIQSFERDEEFLNISQPVILRLIDDMWTNHLTQMTYLKEGIGLRSYQGEDPMQVYQQEGIKLFAKNLQRLRRQILEESVSLMKTLRNEGQKANPVQ